MDWGRMCWGLCIALVLATQALACGDELAPLSEAPAMVPRSPDQLAAEGCTDGIDDDGDGAIDCDDSDCERHVACVTRSDEDCGNLIDDDDDGAADCDDEDCSQAEVCLEPPLEDCLNRQDDDGDGAMDCSDADCASHLACLDTCGNRRLDSGETCDGSTLGACDADQICRGCTCVARPVCGDGVINQANERCDGDARGTCDAATERCTESCLCERTCGNGQVDSGEECDGDLTGICEPGVEFCTEACTCGNECGDLFIDPGAGEECDGDDLTCGEGRICVEDLCACAQPYCGDGRRLGDEQCDPGVLERSPGVGCDDPQLACQPETCECVSSVCGDARITGTEQCDFDRFGDGVGCSEEGASVCDPVGCQCVASVCGDGRITGLEACESELLDACDIDGPTPTCGEACACAEDTCPEGLVVLEAHDYDVDIGRRWLLSGVVPSGVSHFNDCDGATGSEVLVRWDVPTSARYAFVVDSEHGVSVSLRSICHPARGARECGRLTTGDYGIGDQLFLAVDGPAAAQGEPFSFEWGLVDEVGLEEGCTAPFVACRRGLACDDGRCEVSQAPVLSSFTAFESADGSHRLQFSGTDANRDLTGVTVFAFDRSGDLIIGPEDVAFEPEQVVYEQDDFSAAITLSAGDVHSYSAWVTDAAGSDSAALTATVESASN